jgi:TonB family protein
VLRIGVVRGEDIVDDRVVPRVETIYVGTTDECHFEVRSRKLEAEKFALFEVTDGQYFLRFTDAMDGRLGLQGSVKGFAELRSSGLATQDGDVHRIALPRNGRGKVVIGGTSLLFELVPAPPPPPEPPPAPEPAAEPSATKVRGKRPRSALPTAVRARLLADIDWYFTGFVVSSFLLFFLGFVLLETYDPVVEAHPELISERYARFIFDEPTPPPPPPEEVPEDETEDEAAEEDAPAEPQERRANRPTPSDSAPATEERRASLTREIGHQVQSAMIGAVSEIQGSLADALAAGLDMRVSAADAIAQAQGIGVADGTAGSILTREGGTGGTGSGERGSLGALAEGPSGGAQAVATKAVSEQRVRGRVGLASGGITGGAGDFDASVVRQMISRRIRAIQACYERSLRQNPNAAGRVVVRFTIQPSGTVSGASAVENSTGDPGVASCVVGTVSRFRFSPGPTGGSVTVSYPFVFAPQG